MRVFMGKHQCGVWMKPECFVHILLFFACNGDEKDNLRVGGRTFWMRRCFISEEFDS